jgi:hypothetical protein
MLSLSVLCTATRSNLRAATRLCLTAEQIISHGWTRMNTDKKRQKNWGQKNDERAWIGKSFCP